MMITLLDNLLYIALIVLVLVLLGVYIVRRPSQERAEIFQLIAARASFSKTVSAVATKVPPSTDYWENKIVDDMPYVSKILNHAVQQLSPFLSDKERIKLEKEWLSTKSFIEKKLADKLLTAGMLYGGTVAMAISAKDEFHNRIQSLLKYSEEV